VLQKLRRLLLNIHLDVTLPEVAEPQ
jgi:hypothetical protein